MDKKILPQLVACSDLYQQYETEDVITWCDGCGNYSIQNALKRALALEKIEQRDVVFAFDVGCVGNGSDKIEGYTIHGLHGRVLPLAVGAQLANQKIKVIAAAGDGGTFSEGVNHLVHAIRNDYPILFLHYDNQNYALTTGQPSSTTPKGCKMNSAPEGSEIEPLNPLEMVLSLKPSFVARTCSADTDHMTEIFRKALNHKGFAFIEILQTCPTYNKVTSNEWYLDRIRPIEELKDYDVHNIWDARKISEEMDILYVGVLYHNPNRESFLECTHRDGIKTTLVEEVKYYDISEFLKEL